MNFSKANTHSASSLIITVLVSAVPVSIYYYYVKTYSTNVPFWDDYTSVLQFLFTYIQSDSITEKIRLILSQHSEHRIVFNKIVILTIYYLTHELDLKMLIWIGNLSLVGVLFLLYKYLLSKQHHILYGLPVPFLLFQLQYHENIYWAMASVANLYVVLFAFTSLYFASQISSDSGNDKNLIIALAFAFIATFTNGNGFFTFIIINLLLLYKGSKKQLLITICVTVATLIIYFYGYERLTSDQSLILVLRRPKRTIFSFIYFLGGAAGGLDKGVGFFGEPYILLTGTTVLFWISYLCYKQYYKNHPFIFSCFLFLLITAAAATVTRSGFGQVYTLAPRYKMYSLLFIILSYLALLDLLKPKPLKVVMPLCLAVSIMLNIVFYYQYTDFMHEHKKSLLVHMGQWKNFSYVYHDNFLLPNPQLVADVLRDTVRDSIYKPPQLDIIKHPKEVLPVIPIEINFQEKNQIYSISNRNFPEHINKKALCLMLESDSNSYIFNVYQQVNDMSDVIRTGTYYQEELKAEIPRQEIQKGKYSINLYTITPEHIVFLAATNKTLIID